MPRDIIELPVLYAFLRRHKEIVRGEAGPKSLACLGEFVGLWSNQVIVAWIMLLKTAIDYLYEELRTRDVLVEITDPRPPDPSVN